MAFMRLSSFQATKEVHSSILNWVCPECGGRMGGRGNEYKCQGECQTDWRQIWKRILPLDAKTRRYAPKQPRFMPRLVNSANS